MIELAEHNQAKASYTRARIQTPNPQSRIEQVSERSKAILESTITTNAAQTARAAHVAKKGAETLGRQSFLAASDLTSTAFNEINRYTPDVLDVGQHGETDLSVDGGRFVAGQAAMGINNAIKINYWVAQHGVDALNQAVYGDKRMNRIHDESVAARESISGIYEPYLKSIQGSQDVPYAKNARERYLDVITGRSYRDIESYSDRLAWNRLERNQFSALPKEYTEEIVRTLFVANREVRMEQRSERLTQLQQDFKNRQFSFTKSAKKTFANQRRKGFNAITRGNDSDSTVSRSLYAAQKSFFATVGLARTMYRRKEMILNFLNEAVHPVRFTRKIVIKIVDMVEKGIKVITSIPAIISSLTVLLPVILIGCLFSVLFALFTNIASVQIQQQSPAILASPDYAANAFIYEAKQRNWTENAIVGVLAYQLAEGGGMGTFTYENYYVLEGPSGVLNDTLQDNEAWLDWINDSYTLAKQNQLYYASNTSNYAAMGLGVLQDSDVWSSPSQKTVSNATKLIHYAQDKGRSWQDPQTQMEYNFEHRFSAPLAFDTAGVDPTKDERSAEEWCRRVTAGIGMPAWSYTTNNSFMQSHIKQIPAAQNYFDNFKAFDYADMSNIAITTSPNFNLDAAWGAGNPFTNGFRGQCTWFAWGRFYEIYGFDGGFRGNGRDCVRECIAAHPDKFAFSLDPVPGALFSWTAPGQNHVGMVVAVDGDNITIMDGNVDGGVSDATYGPNHPLSVATKNWRVQTFPSSYMKSMGSIYANPIKK